MGICRKQRTIDSCSSIKSLTESATPTIILAENVHPKIVQERLGHGSIAITMDIYSHLMPNMQGDAAKTVDGVMRAAIKKPDDETIG